MTGNNEYKKYYSGNFTDGNKVARSLGYSNFENMRESALNSREGAEKFIDKVVEIKAIPDTQNETVGLDNLLVDSLVWQGFKFRNPYSRIFFQEKRTEWGDKVRIVANGQITPTDWDKNKFVPTEPTIPEQYDVVLVNNIRKKFSLTIYKPVLKAAFASYWSLDDFISDILSTIERSLHLWFFDLIGTDLGNSIKNVKVSTGKTWSAIMGDFGGIVESLMAPTTDYNSGYKPNTTTLYDKTNIIQGYGDVVMVINPKTYGIARNTYLPYLIQTLKINPFETFEVIKDPKVPENEFWVESRIGYYITSRIDIDESQYYTENMAFQKTTHFWPIFGQVPFNIGFKFQFTIPVDNVNYVVETVNSTPVPMFNANPTTGVPTIAEVTVSGEVKLSAEGIGGSNEKPIINKPATSTR